MSTIATNNKHVEGEYVHMEGAAFDPKCGAMFNSCRHYAYYKKIEGVYEYHTLSIQDATDGCKLELIRDYYYGCAIGFDADDDDEVDDCWSHDSYTVTDHIEH
jgi:hypothetical protein